MKVTDLTVEAASVASWKDVIDEDQSRPVSLVMENLPELYEAHKKKVKAIFETDFHPHRSIAVATDAKFTMADLTEDGRRIHANLIEYLKNWYRKNEGG
jgi:hypothetical protein